MEDQRRDVPEGMPDEPRLDSAYGASSSESGGNYDAAGPTAAGARGEAAGEERRCEFCGQSIDIGQAWMRADVEGAEMCAHAECLYREEPTATEHRHWEPGS